MEAKPLGMKIKSTEPIGLAQWVGCSVTQNEAEKRNISWFLVAVGGGISPGQKANIMSVI